MTRGILLAAGASTRFGRDKLLYPVDGATTVVELAAQHLIDAISDCVAVVKPDSDELAQRLRNLGFVIVTCEAARHGMGFSIAAGVAATAAAARWVIALGDMPWIQPNTIRTIAQAVTAPCHVGVPLYRGARGHPVVFGGAWRDALQSIAADHGARQLIERVRKDIVTVSVDDPGVCRDVDRPVDIPHGVAS